MAVDLLRKLPMSLEAEQAVLGAILIKPDAFADITGIVYAEDFYLEEHKKIFIALQSMFLSSRSVDTVTLVNTLVSQGAYRDSESSIGYLSALADAVPSAANIKDYAKIVHEKSILRALIGACDEISADAYGEKGEVEQILDASAQKIFDVAQKKDSREFKHIRDVMQVVYRDLQDLSENPDRISGVRTGFSALDSVLVQLGKGDIVIVGARPGMGKTSFAMNIATQVAKAEKKTVAVFSLEMSAEQLALRMLSSEALVDSRALRSGRIQPEDWQRLADATTMLASCDILIDDSTGVTPTDMKSKLRRVQNLGMIVIDYLQLMQSGKKIENRAQEVGEISRNLKIMAKDLGVPVICCAQLSRNPEGRGNATKKPMLSDLRDSGSIEQDADIVLFLYRDEYYKTTDTNAAKAAEEAANTAEIIVAKNRHGAVGSVTMGWNAQFTKFRTLDDTDRVEP